METDPFLDDLEDFLAWWRSLNPAEPIDMAEAMEVFFNQQQ
jgi:hypothetical protein